MTDRELMQQALETLVQIHPGNMTPMAEEAWNKSIALLGERLSQPEQTVSMTEYKRLQDLVTSQGIRLMDYESDQRVQEPFCYHDGRNIVGKEFADHSDVFPLYVAPCEWQGLTREEFLDAVYGLEDLEDCWRAIEDKLRQKNQ